MVLATTTTSFTVQFEGYFDPHNSFLVDISKKGRNGTLPICQVILDPTQRTHFFAIEHHKSWFRQTVSIWPQVRGVPVVLPRGGTPHCDYQLQLGNQHPGNGQHVNITVSKKENPADQRVGYTLVAEVDLPIENKSFAKNPIR